MEIWHVQRRGHKNLGDIRKNKEKSNFEKKHSITSKFYFEIKLNLNAVFF